MPAMLASSMLASSMLPLLQAAADPMQGELSTTAFVVSSIVKLLVVFGATLGIVAFLTWLERRVAAWIQDRQGPNRVGPMGLFQPVADGLKNFLKERTYPSDIYKPIFLIAPALSFVPALLTFAVIPFATPLPTPWGLVPMVVADLPVGFLFILAISSLGVYGLALAGWSSNNKYALLGGLRSSAQMVSYEIAMGMSTIPVLLLAGNVSMSQVIAQQVTTGWNVFLLSIAFFIFFVAAFAETNRLPFDLPEAESELVAGYHTEYSGMGFAMFPLAEYAAMITASGLMVTLFFGGWDIPFLAWDNVPPWTVLKTLATFASFGLKTGLFLFTFIWVRWTLPRFRYDQLMSLGWKVMLPLALGYIVLVASAILVLDWAGVPRGTLYGAILFAINAVLTILLFVVLDRGRLVSPASSRARAEEVARLRRVSQLRLAVSRGEVPEGMTAADMAAQAGD